MKNNKMFMPYGLLAGSLIGLLTGVIFQEYLLVYLIIGSSFGLLIGSIISLYLEKDTKK